MTESLFLLCIVVGLTYVAVQAKVQIHMLQQTSYMNERYIKWLRSNKSRLFEFKDILPLGALLICMGGYSMMGYGLWLAVYAFLLLTRKKIVEKKKLVFTFRVRRLIAGMTLVMSILFGFCITVFNSTGLLTMLYLISVFPFVLLLAGNTLLQPVEKIIQDYYYRQAKSKLEQMQGLTVIGLTGSFGKTSTKNVLARILSAKHNTLMTPESYNTTMGVVRTIREQLKSTHEMFVVEMGAKQKGDIKEICDLVSPSHVVLTAIGEQHLETFKNLETIVKTKYEIIEAVPDDGVVLLNFDDENIRRLPRSDNKKYVYFGMENDEVDYYAYDIKFDANGTHFIVRNRDGEERKITTKLLGRHNVSNILAGIAVAAELGMDLKTIDIAVRDLHPIEHRLSIIKHPNNVTVLDDAFNSNPVGSRMALEVLGEFAGHKKILVSPGMVELGDRHYDVNKKFGELAASVCDYVILVGQQQTSPL